MSSSTNSVAIGGSAELQAILADFARQCRPVEGGELEESLLEELIRSFDTTPGLARRSMRELLTRSTERFWQAAFHVSRKRLFGPGMDHLGELLVEHDVLLLALADPELLPPANALDLVRRLCKLDPRADGRLARHFVGKSDAPVEQLERVLDLLDAISDGVRIAPLLMHLQRHDNSWVRAKAVRLMARTRTNASWLDQQLRSGDPQSRAGALESFLQRKLDENDVALLWLAAADTHHRVATTALLVLHRAGFREAGTRLEELSQAPQELMRAAAAWAMGMSSDERFLPVLQKMARADAGPPRRMALRMSALLRRMDAQKAPGGVPNGSTDAESGR